MKSPRRVLRYGIVLLLLAGGAAAWRFWPQLVSFRHRAFPSSSQLASISSLPRSRRVVRMERPYGMAPAAFRAYINACYRARVHPNRITQTLGNMPASKGYHLRDGVLQVRGRRIEYSAATDIHVVGLTRAQISRFVKELSRQGFACWYRHGGKWTRNEHIHAVYAFLPMKWQLEGQVRQYLREKRRARRPVRWEKKWVRYWNRL